MAAYSRVYDSHHLQADCQEPDQYGIHRANFYHPMAIRDRMARKTYNTDV